MHIVQDLHTNINIVYCDVLLISRPISLVERDRGTVMVAVWITNLRLCIHV